MKRIYYLSTCSTCKRILSEIQTPKEFELIDIKTTSIDADTLDFIKDKVGSYEALFSKRAMKYKSLGLGTKNLTEADYRSLMLEEYTFLKRPFVIIEDDVFIGNSAKTVLDIKKRLQEL